MKRCVIAITATYRRAPQLAVLLRSLAESGPALAGVIVVDNGNDAATAEVVAGSPLACHRLVPDCNLGCGGGLALAETAAPSLFPEMTHLWILDDDVRAEPDALSKLLQTMEAESADAACPFIVDGAGHITRFPGLNDGGRRAALRGAAKPADYLEHFDAAAASFSWCTGVALLITASIFQRIGPHRGDYWIRGEDLEFSLRLTSVARGIFVPSALVHHLPPEAGESALGDDEFEKHGIMLQNLAYTASRLPHGRSLLLSLPGNMWRFFRSWGFSARTARIAGRAFWRGAFLGLPAGVAPRASERAMSLADFEAQGAEYSRTAGVIDTLHGYFRNMAPRLHKSCQLFGLLSDPLGDVLEIGPFFSYVPFILRPRARSYTVYEGDDPVVAPLLPMYEQAGIACSAIDLFDLFGPVRDAPHRLPLADNSFDRILCWETMEHFNFNPVKFVRELHRLIRPGGQVCITVPNRASFQAIVQLFTGRGALHTIKTYFQFEDYESNGKKAFFGFHWREYASDELYELFTKAGFRVTRHGTFAEFIDPTVTGFFRRAARTLSRIATRLLPRYGTNVYLIATK